MSPRKPTDLARSSLRALDVLLAFRDAGRPMSLSELSRRTGIPVSTCHGVVRLLDSEGWLFRVTTREYYPTRRLWSLADELRRQDPVLQSLEPPLRALGHELGETIVVGLRQGDVVRALVELQGRYEIRYTAPPGAVRALHAVAIGKVYLAAMSAEEFAAWFDRSKLERYTERTLVTAAALREDVEDGEVRGYQRAVGEYNPDAMGLAVPLRVGALKLVVGVAGPLARMQPIEAMLAHRLTRGVRQLQQSLQR